MKVWMRTRYGGPEVLELVDAPDPVPAADEVVVRVRAASLNAADRYLLRGRPLALRLLTGLRRPRSRRLGQDVAGVVEALGANVRRFAVGDAVFGAVREDFHADVDRALAERARLREDLLVKKPDGVSFEEAAAVPMAGLTALQGLRQGGLRAGHQVLVTGATGGVGSFAVQIARAAGAEVTAVCGPTNAELARALGARTVLDHSRDDPTARAERYDLFLDVAATRSPSRCRRVLAPGGAYVWVGTPRAGGPVLGPFAGALRVSLAALLWRRLSTLAERPNQEDLGALAEMLRTGAVKPHVERRFGLDELPEAVRAMETGHSRGKIVVVV
jgi:NADPH:quinone reductase-like Zn-dependent oxidoreductase